MKRWKAFLVEEAWFDHAFIVLFRGYADGLDHLVLLLRLVVGLLLLVNFLFELDYASFDPRVLESFLWFHSLFYLPLQALVNEFHKLIIV